MKASIIFFPNESKRSQRTGKIPLYKLGDFKEITNNTSQDYSYDANGNMISDNIKVLAAFFIII